MVGQVRVMLESGLAMEQKMYVEPGQAPFHGLGQAQAPEVLTGSRGPAGGREQNALNNSIHASISTPGSATAHRPAWS